MRRAAVLGWPLACALAICAPLLAPGYVIGYDMVFVPDLGLRRDVLGLGTALPRAVPSDAVVAVLDNVAGGMLLSKLVVLAIPAVAGWGMAALVREIRRGTVTALAAATLYVWSPYVAERLVLGHWALLLGYAALPWLVRSCLRLRRGERRAWAAMVLATAGCALSASGGLVGALVALAVVAWPVRGLRWRLVGGVAAAVVALNAPWWVAGLTSPGTAIINPAGVAAFAARDEGYGGVLPTLLTLGGVWNSDAVPSSRGGPLSIAGTALVVALAATGIALCRRLDRQLAAPLVAAAAVALVIGLFGAVAPSALRDLVTAVPGAGILRDGQRYLGPLVLLEALGFGLAVGRIAAAVRRRLPLWSRWAVAAALVLLPVAVLPDLAWAVDGRIGVASYPPDWAAARRVVHGPGDLIPWPYESYRAPPFTDGRPVLDPIPRYFPRPAVPPDELVVGGVRLAGEDARAAAIATALRSGRDATAALLANGVGWIVVDRTAAGGQDPRSAVRGAEAVFSGPTVAVYAVAGEPARITPGERRTVAMIAAWAAAALAVVAGLAGFAGQVWRRA
jgi:hypothetical protein